MELDFSRLDSIGNADAKEKPKTDLKKIYKSTDRNLDKQSEINRNKLEQSSEILKEYQENKKKVIELNTQILKGAIAGMNTEQLLDISLDVISILIHDTSFKDMVKSNITRAKDKA